MAWPTRTPTKEASTILTCVMLTTALFLSACLRIMTARKSLRRERTWSARWPSVWSLSSWCSSPASTAAEWFGTNNHQPKQNLRDISTIWKSMARISKVPAKMLKSKDGPLMNREEWAPYTRRARIEQVALISCMTRQLKRRSLRPPML